MRLRSAVLTLTLVPCLLAGAGFSQLITLPPAGGDPNAGMQDDGAAAVPQSLGGRVAASLAKGEYDQLDRIADKARREKTRAAGGAWRLRSIYSGLSAASGSATGYEDTITRLQAWIAAEPESITPRVALADTYIRYAWQARGSGEVDTVTAAGWKLFEGRIAQAKSTLDEADKLTAKCPQWYSEMQTVALAQGWEPNKAKDLFERATAFEPGYYYYYQAYANYLLPKWEGKQGQSSAFAKESADKIGGDQGDFLYFRIGTVLLGSSNNNYPVKQLDWERLQRGYTALTKLYGMNNTDLNDFALMTWRYKDLAAATPVFAQIGQKWSKNAWKTRQRFDHAKAWALEGGPATPLGSTIPSGA